MIALFGVLAAISNQLLDGFSKDALVLAFFFIVITILYSVMFLDVFVSGDDKDVELLRFLSWLEKDLKSNV